MHLITINANGQILSMCKCDQLVSDSINVLGVQFVFDSAWAGMEKVAQFTQKSKETQKYKTYNVVINDLGFAAIPNEITDGVCIISVFGSAGLARLTTAPLAVSVLKSGFIPDGETPIPPTPDLYQQLVAKIHAAAGVPVIGNNGNWFLNGEDTGIRADWTAEQDNAAASAAAAEASAQEAAKNAENAANSATAAAESAAAAISAPPIVERKEGAIVSLADASNLPLQGLTIYGKTTQDGTPTPESPVPLVSAGDGGSIGVNVSGKNLLKNTLVSETYKGITFTANPDGSIILDGTSNADAIRNIYTGVLPQGEYIVSGAISEQIRLRVAKNNDLNLLGHDSGNGYKFTLTEPSTILIQVRVAAGVTVSNQAIFPKLEVGSIATAFEPYKNGSITLSTPNGLPGIPVSSGGNYTDRNGQQWIADEINLERGVKVQRVGRIKSPTPFVSAYTNRNGIAVGVLRDDAVVSTNTVIGNILCDSMPIVIANTQYATNQHCIAASEKRILITVTDITTREKLEQWLNDNPITVLYVLGEPIETPLTAEETAAYRALHSNKPNTTVYNGDGAGQRVEYVVDTKLYIDERIAAIAAAVTQE